MALPDLTGKNIQDTYQRILQVDGPNGVITDGTGSALISASFQYISASHLDLNSETLSIGGSPFHKADLDNLREGKPMVALGHQLTGKKRIPQTGDSTTVNLTSFVKVDAVVNSNDTDTFMLNDVDNQIEFITAGTGSLLLDGGRGLIRVGHPNFATFYYGGHTFVGDTNTLGNITASGDISSSGTIHAITFSGDGSNLTGIEQTDISALNTFTSSIQTDISTLTAATSSYNTSTANVTLDTSTVVVGDVTSQVISSTQIVDTTPTSSNGIFYNYTLDRLTSPSSSVGSRAGNLAIISDGINSNISDYTVTAIGGGDDPYFTTNVSKSNTQLTLNNGAGYHFRASKQHFVAPTSKVIIPDPDTATPLLDTYTGAAAAYSLRKLRTAYTGSVIRIRRASDNTETDIGFDVNNNLDTTAISIFCGSSNGFVEIWYDQSGNANNAVQETQDSQPKIYDGSAVITENGKPALDFDGTMGLAVNLTATFTNIGIWSVHAGTDGSMFGSYPGSSPRHFVGHSMQSGFYRSRIRNTAKAMRTVDVGATSDTQVLQHMHYDQSNLGVSIDGETLQTITSTIGDIATSTNGFVIGGTPDNLSLNGSLQELLVWNADQSSNRTSIETNINNHYSIYDTGLLVDYPGAVAAYSVRQLTTAATASMNIRRDSNQGELVIGFTSNGDLDTGSIETFCTGTECYVDTWYDQSGNGNDAVQGSKPNQPLIYISGSVFTKNNIAAVDFSRGTPNEPAYNDYKKKIIKFTLPSTIAQPTTYTMVHDYKDGPSYGRIFGGTNQQMLQSLIVAGGYLGTPSPKNIYQVNSIIFSGSNSIRRVNNSQVTLGNPGSGSISGDVYIGGSGNSANYWGSGSFQEFIFWPSNQSTLGNISAIETNTNSYFNIY